MNRRTASSTAISTKVLQFAEPGAHFGEFRAVLSVIPDGSFGKMIEQNAQTIGGPRYEGNDPQSHRWEAAKFIQGRLTPFSTGQA